MVGASASATSGAGVRPSLNTTARAIRRMGTLVEDAGGSLADLNYGRCAGSSTRLIFRTPEN